MTFAQTEVHVQNNSSAPGQNGRISQKTVWNAFSWMKSFVFPDSNSPKFVPKGPVDNKSASVKVIA